VAAPHPSAPQEVSRLPVPTTMPAGRPSAAARAVDSVPSVVANVAISCSAERSID